MAQVGLYHDQQTEDGGSSKENRNIYSESMPRRVGSFYRGQRSYQYFFYFFSVWRLIATFIWFLTFLSFIDKIWMNQIACWCGKHDFCTFSWFLPLKTPQARNKKQINEGKIWIFSPLHYIVLATCKEQLVKADCTEIRSKWPSSHCALQQTKNEWLS